MQVALQSLALLLFVTPPLSACLLSGIRQETALRSAPVSFAQAGAGPEVSPHAGLTLAARVGLRHRSALRRLLRRFVETETILDPWPEPRTVQIPVNGVNKSVTLNNAGYMTIALLKNRPAMEAFFQEAAKSEGMVVWDTAVAQDVVRFYDGECETQDYPTLLAELKEAQSSNGCFGAWASMKSSDDVALEPHPLRATPVGQDWPGRGPKLWPNALSTAVTTTAPFAGQAAQQPGVPAVNVMDSFFKAGAPMQVASNSTATLAPTENSTATLALTANSTTSLPLTASSTTTLASSTTTLGLTASSTTTLAPTANLVPPASSTTTLALSSSSAAAAATTLGATEVSTTSMVSSAPVSTTSTAPLSSVPVSITVTAPLSSVPVSTTSISPLSSDGVNSTEPLSSVPISTTSTAPLSSDGVNSTDPLSSVPFSTTLSSDGVNSTEPLSSDPISTTSMALQSSVPINRTFSELKSDNEVNASLEPKSSTLVPDGILNLSVTGATIANAIRTLAKSFPALNTTDAPGVTASTAVADAKENESNDSTLGTSAQPQAVLLQERAPWMESKSIADESFEGHIRSLVFDMGGTVTDDGALAGFAPWYSNGKNSHESLVRELHEISQRPGSWIRVDANLAQEEGENETKPFIVPADAGESVDLDEKGYLAVLTLGSIPQMELFLRRVLEQEHLVLTDSAGLAAFASYYHGDCARIPLQALIAELHLAAKASRECGGGWLMDAVL